MGSYSPLTSHDPRLPKSLTDCETAGLSGWCGGSCPVLRAGECPTHGEMESELPLSIRLVLSGLPRSLERRAA